MCSTTLKSRKHSNTFLFLNLSSISSSVPSPPGSEMPTITHNWGHPFFPRVTQEASGICTVLRAWGNISGLQSITPPARFSSPGCPFKMGGVTSSCLPWTCICSLPFLGPSPQHLCAISQRPCHESEVSLSLCTDSLLPPSPLPPDVTWSPKSQSPSSASGITA